MLSYLYDYDYLKINKYQQNPYSILSMPVPAIIYIFLKLTQYTLYSINLYIERNKINHIHNQSFNDNNTE